MNDATPKAPLPDSDPPRQAGQEPCRWIGDLFERADVRINGNRAWDFQVRDRRVWKRLARWGSLGLGESYMDGWWDSEAIDEMIHRLLRSCKGGTPQNRMWSVLQAVRSGAVNLQSRARAFQVGEAHYDIGNDLYRRMLDTRLTYTCAYWGAGAETLEEAQRDKLELICRKLKLRPGMRVLDIGCGWGSFCRYAAENYGVNGVGLTVSGEQARLGNERCKDLPMEIRLQDYRDMDERFDRVLSVGMFEHVGPKNHRTYMEVTRRCLKPEGLSLLHTIGNNITCRSPDGFITRYIFPNGHLPSLAQIGRAMEGCFVAEDLHNFGWDYDRTLMTWHERVDAAWPELEDLHPRYNRRFQRMWRYYLLSCAGAFRARKMQLWQWVLSSGERREGYARVAG